LEDNARVLEAYVQRYTQRPEKRGKIQQRRTKTCKIHLMWIY